VRPAEGGFADAPLAALVLHIHRELIHHVVEVSLLRDHVVEPEEADRPNRPRQREGLEGSSG
jgi:hypothetical protein